MNCVNNLTALHVSSRLSPARSEGEGVLIMDACSVTALGIKQVLMTSCGIREPPCRCPRSPWSRSPYRPSG